MRAGGGARRVAASARDVFVLSALGVGGRAANHAVVGLAAEDAVAGAVAGVSVRFTVGNCAAVETADLMIDRAWLTRRPSKAYRRCVVCELVFNEPAGCPACGTLDREQRMLTWFAVALDGRRWTGYA